MKNEDIIKNSNKIHEAIKTEPVWIASDGHFFEIPKSPITAYILDRYPLQAFEEYFHILDYEADKEGIQSGTLSDLGYYVSRYREDGYFDTGEDTNANFYNYNIVYLLDVFNLNKGFISLLTQLDLALRCLKMQVSVRSELLFTIPKEPIAYTYGRDQLLLDIGGLLGERNFYIAYACQETGLFSAKIKKVCA